MSCPSPLPSSWALLLGASLAACCVACNAETPPLLVRGVVETSMFDAAYTEVRALTESNPRAAAAPISRQTPGFVLALSGPGPFELQFLGTNLVQPLRLVLAADVPFTIVPCAGTSLVDLGVIRLAPGACAESIACTRAQDELMLCQIQEQASCDQLAAEVEACHSGRDALCGPLQTSLDDCMRSVPGGMDCSEQQRLVTECLATHDCSTGEQAYLTRCLSVCRPQRERVAAECAATGPCPPGPAIAVPEDPSPSKCGQDGTPQGQGGAR